jgi:hypothetical protein
MPVSRLLVPLVSLALAPAVSFGLATSSAGSVPAHPAHAGTPVLVAVRASHHRSFDRVVFQYRGGLPASRHARYVHRLIADGSGDVVPIAGRAILLVRMERAQAHTRTGAATVPSRAAYPWPNVMDSVIAGDFEGVVSYGLGLAKRTPFHVFTLRSPSRVVVDVRASFRTSDRRVWFVDAKRVSDNTPPFVTPTSRPVIPSTPAVGLLDRLFAGVRDSERADSLRFVRSGATGYRLRSIRHDIARVQLTGGCRRGTGPVTIADEVQPTLRALASVRWVKIYSPAGRTEHPSGHTDSIPSCLAP